MDSLMAALQFLVCIVLVSWPAAAIANLITKDGCQEKCGEIEIPYPFGIGTPQCYRSDWFEVLCDKTLNPPKPILKRTQLELLGISVQNGTVHVNGPVLDMACDVFNDKGPMKGLDLSLTPFIFSQISNRFVAVACGYISFMAKGLLDIYGGCMANCKTGSERFVDYNIDSICNGLDCCQTAIPDNLAVFDTFCYNFLNNTEAAIGFNKYSFLVEKTWFDQNVTDLIVVRNLSKVPVVLDWSMQNYTFKDFDLVDSVNSSFRCENSSVESNPDTKKFQCFCRNGYVGNPYIPDGCQDIDECSEPPRNSCGNNECINIPGSYICVHRPRKDVAKLVTIGICTGALGLAFVLSGLWKLWTIIQKKKEKDEKQKFFEQNGGLLLEKQIFSGVEKIKVFTSKELEKATDNFNEDRKLGEGGQGTVYKGMLVDGGIVAVKSSTKICERNLAQFINEIVVLSQINHRNVVRLLGCCLETQVPLLVYEYIPNGALFQYLHCPRDDFILTWEKRLRIALEIAGALSYLHFEAASPIFHRDIKSTNILLDENYRAKIADFGTSKSVEIDQTHATTETVQGTIGYMDPEYFQSNQYTGKSDVYSFGVVLVELITGQSPTSERNGSLTSLFMMSVGEDRLFEIVDGKIMNEGKEKEILEVSKIAKRCVDAVGRNRPTIKQVLLELEAIQKSN